MITPWPGGASPGREAAPGATCCALAMDASARTQSRSATITGRIHALHPPPPRDCENVVQRAATGRGPLCRWSTVRLPTRRRKKYAPPGRFREGAHVERVGSARQRTVVERVHEPSLRVEDPRANVTPVRRHPEQDVGGEPGQDSGSRPSRCRRLSGVLSVSTAGHHRRAEDRRGHARAVGVRLGVGHFEPRPAEADDHAVDEHSGRPAPELVSHVGGAGARVRRVGSDVGDVREDRIRAGPGRRS